MTNRIGYSSELYEIDPADLLLLPDSPDNLTQCQDEIIVLLGNKDLGRKDTLIRGRNKVKSALNNGISYIPVRFAFQSTIPDWNWLPLFIKKFRYPYKFFSTNIYHLRASRIRELKLERGIRTKANAYAITNKKWAIPEAQRIQKYNQLLSSLKNGFDDNYPISIMLCRKYGCKDCVDNGHHRLGICIEAGIDRIATNFIAAGSLPHFLQKLLLKCH